MAVSMTATLSIPANVIAGQKFTASLSLIEGGGTATNLVSIQPFLLTQDGKQARNVRFGVIANAATIGSYTGAADTISASSTKIFNFDVVIDETGGWGSPSAASQTYRLSATVQTSDGSVFGPTGQAISVSSPSAGPSTSSPAPNGNLGQSVIFGTTTNQYSNVVAAGSLRYDLPLNTIALPTLLIG